MFNRLIALWLHVTMAIFKHLENKNGIGLRRRKGSSAALGALACAVLAQVLNAASVYFGASFNRNTISYNTAVIIQLTDWDLNTWHLRPIFISLWHADVFHYITYARLIHATSLRIHWPMPQQWIAIYGSDRACLSNKSCSAISPIGHSNSIDAGWRSKTRRFSQDRLCFKQH